MDRLRSRRVGGRPRKEILGETEMTEKATELKEVLLT